jgi:hypothetical protein
LVKDELKRQKQQTQYFNKLNKEDYAELLNYRDTTPSQLAKQPMTTASKYQKQKDANQILSTNTNSRFKPINKPNVKSTPPTQTPPTGLATMTVTSSSTPGVLNITRKTSQQTLFKESIINARKHLKFSGPEFWLNFRFDQQILAMDLPLPIL